MAKYYAEGTSYNPIQSKTGFRSGDRDSSYNEAKVASNVFAPPATVPLLDGVPNWQAEESDNNDNNDSSNASTQMSLDQANTNLGNTNIEVEQAANTGMYGPTLNPLDFFPGLGLMANLNAPAVPTYGYGTPGTYSSITGNKFDAQSRGISPITGYAMPEYGTKKAF